MSFLDKSNVFGSIAGLSKQVMHAWEDAGKINLPSAWQKFDQVVMGGMGGSLLGARVISAVYGNELKLPLVLVNGYEIPDWVNKKTLVICSSYSGNTEETLNNFNLALKKQAKIIVVAAAGRLLELAKANNLPYYAINPLFNPSNQPRLAIGYSIIGQLVLLKKAGLINLSRESIDAAVATMTTVIQAEAEILAAKMKGKQVILTGAEHLTGAIHVVKNQLNENAKHLCHRYDLPELNHHLMEGLRFPESNSKTVLFWFLDSSLYSSAIRRRLEITQEVVEKNNLETVVSLMKAESKLAQVFEFIQLGAYTGFYLSQLHKIDPAEIPWVNYFKKRLRTYEDSLRRH